MIKNLIKGLMIAILLVSSFHYTAADVEPLPPPEPLTVQELVAKYSVEYKVSAKIMMAVIKCENTELDPDLQSRLKYKKNNRWGKPAGSYEQSYGLVQIHLPDNPDVSYEEATDPEFAIEFLAQKLKTGRGGMWTCYRKLT